MDYQNDDLRIKEIKELLPPVALLEKYPATERAAATVSQARQAIHRILHGEDDRLLVVIGPCSIHDTAAAKEYAARLLTLRDERYISDSGDADAERTHAMWQMLAELVTSDVRLTIESAVAHE